MVSDAPLEYLPLIGPLKRALPRWLKVGAKEHLRRLSFRRHMALAVRSPGLLADAAFLARFRAAWGNVGYSAETPFLTEVLARVRKGPRASVLECGSGISTILTGLALSPGTGNVWALENDVGWFQRVAHVIQKYQIRNVQLIHARLQSYGDYSWYAPPLARMPKFNLVICDGPTETTAGGRYGVLSVMKAHLADDAVVLLDDAHTATGHGVLARWQDEGRARVELREGATRGFAIVTVQKSREH
jgi:hypothetical protein